MPINSYADLQTFFTNILTTNQEMDGALTAPHGAFWNDLSYEQFTAGTVPGVKNPATGKEDIPVLKKGNSAASNLILALRGQGPLFGDTGPFGQMPANGPPMFTDQQIADVASWIDRGCPK